MQRLAIILALVAVLSACNKGDGSGIQCAALDEERYADELATLPPWPAGQAPPATFEAALAAMDDALPPSRKAQIRCLMTESAAPLHFTTGLWLRNEWLAGRSPLARNMGQMGFVHPDDMSSALILAYAHQLRRETFDVAAFAGARRTSWRQRGVDVDAAQARITAP
ncbi:hypothetical protein U91I_02983 [alpha proteobacterium U9-1i]|nr:hypothetical protein U91I_02983 [alpha proteobacterium U9-1i]